MRQIIAIGGGGFSMEPENPLLDEYILNVCEEKKPRICFLPTASGDSESYTLRFYDFFSKQNCEPAHLSLFKPEQANINEFLLNQDIIYVGGGSTRNMLAIWSDWGIDHTLREAWEKGIILAGISAGAICWFEEGMTDSRGSELEPISCLGFLPGSCCPHYDGEINRRSFYQTHIINQKLLPGFAIDDGAALHFAGEKVKKAVSSRPNAKVVSVYTQGNDVIEKVVPISHLY